MLRDGFDAVYSGAPGHVINQCAERRGDHVRVSIVPSGFKVSSSGVGDPQKIGVIFRTRIRPGATEKNRTQRKY
jgi:hypothetical protein